MLTETSFNYRYACVELVINQEGAIVQVCVVHNGEREQFDSVAEAIYAIDMQFLGFKSN